MPLFGSSENFSQLTYSPMTSTVMVDSTTDINAGVTSVADIKDSYNTQYTKIDNSVRDQSTRLLDSLNTVYNAPAVTVGGMSESLSKMGLDLGSFFNMPTTGQTAKLNPELAGGFWSSSADKAVEQRGSNGTSIVGTLVKLALVLGVVYIGFRLIRKRK